MTTPTNSTSASPPTGSTLTPLPSLIPSIPDAWTLLALPIVTYWSLSLLFHWIDINDFLARYRLHTPEEVLNRNHVTRFEVVRDVIVQQVIQTIVGGVTAVFEGVEMVGNERAEIQSLHRQMLLVEKWAWSAFSLAGIDGLQLEKKLGEGVVAMGVDRIFLGALEFVGLPSTEEHGSDWRMSVVEFVYWYILPVVRIWLAIFILDTWQYFLHRAMHESKWLYSE
jgi:sphinganine C4-monooxygenase